MMHPISICVIMRNEEKKMDKFISTIECHFHDYPHELVLVDTGSTDNTILIAHKYTDTVYPFNWISDFSAARNFSLECAHYNYVLVLDCDEIITQLDPAFLDLMINQYPDAVGMLTCRNHIISNNINSIYTDQIERFFNKEIYHYQFPVHEQIRPIHDAPYRRILLPLTIDHFGYQGTPEEMEKKAARNNALLIQMLQKNPNDPYIYFQLGQSFYTLKNYRKACQYYAKGLSFDVDPALDYVQTMVVNYGYSLLELGQIKTALQFQNIYDVFSTTADFVCLMGLIYLRNNMLLQAIDEFEKATHYQHFHAEGTNSFIPLFNLGCINEVIGNINDAITLYQKCGSFPPAQKRLSTLTSQS